MPLAFSLKNDKFDAGVLRVASFTGREVLSQLSRFDLTLGSLQPDIAFDDVVNKPATLVLSEDPDPVQFHGLVADFEQRGFREDRALYHAVLVPRAWLLTLTYQSRIFQEMSVPDIIEKVLLDGGLPSDAFKIDVGTYPTREYVAQCEESDWAFVCRWMEHLGIFFYFDHAGDGDVLVITDDSSACPAAALSATILYRPDSDALADAEGTPTLRELRFRERIGTGLAIVNDYNYRTPQTSLQAESQADPDMPGKRYEYGGHFKEPGEAATLARVRSEALECVRTVLSGGGNIAAFRPGYTFDLNLGAGFRSDLNKPWLLTHVEHFGEQRSGLDTAMGIEGATYSNTFSCIPASVPYRPPRLTPVPRPTFMTAATETTGGDYAYLDEEGRYRARIHFDTGDAAAGAASRWIRMNQPYSGPGYGVHFPNHAGTEMLLAFVNGDPDRPLALGTLPNPSEQSPVTSANKAQNVIRTWGQNELTMDDTSGAENVYLHATKDHTVDVTNDESITIGANRTIEVGGAHQETIGGSMTLDIGASSSETVGASKTLSIGTVYDVEVVAAMNEAVGGAKTEEVGGVKSEAVGASKSEAIGGNRTLTVGADVSVTVGGNESIEIGGDAARKVGGKHAEEITDAYTISAKTIELTAEDEITLKAGSASITLKKNGDVTIDGAKIQVKGSGDVIIKGSQVKAN